ncbi:MAG: FAD-binding protein [Actinomycetota bacterium]|jgi:electron transfer flavoprotein alpha subunit|nr:FAD-binding protein [Actinomycetota bacterium]
MRGLRVVAMVKQIPRFEEMRLGSDGRLVRSEASLEINPHCRRAVFKAVEIARATGGTSMAVTLGPPTAVEALREAVAAGVDEAVLVSDEGLAGSDTLASSRALAAALRQCAPFDLVLCGLYSVDADTGQVPPQLAEMLSLPFVAGVRTLELTDSGAIAGCERDDGWREVRVSFPAVLSVAERLCSPAKASVEARAAVPAAVIRRLRCIDLGKGPWGAEGSPTRVGDVRRLAAPRMRHMLEGPLTDVSRDLVTHLEKRGALDDGVISDRHAVPVPLVEWSSRAVGVVVEPGGARWAREALGAGAQLAAGRAAPVAAVVFEEPDRLTLGSWGADQIVVGPQVALELPAAEALATWAARWQPWCLIGPGTTWGREVMARVAARLGAGLIGDAVDLEVRGDDLVCWKPAFGGQVVASITSTSSIKMVTVRAGALPLLAPRQAPAVVAEVLGSTPASPGLEMLRAEARDETSRLVGAARVVGVGLGVDPADYGLLESLCCALDAEVAATRKVTDRSWLPRGAQVGITGLSIAPRLYVALGSSGKFNHMVGVRRAGTVVAVNTDPEAEVFDHADLGVVGDWRSVASHLVTELWRRRSCLGTSDAQEEPA